MSIWNVLDPSCTYKKWRVDIGTLCGGKFKSFWFKKNALKYANVYKGSSCWVDLINNITEKSIRINDPNSGKKDPNCKHTWMMRSPASWWCPQCHAKFNLSCEHGGSIACATCTKDFVKENEPFENYLAKASW